MIKLANLLKLAHLWCGPNNIIVSPASVENHAGPQREEEELKEEAGEELEEEGEMRPWTEKSCTLHHLYLHPPIGSW